MSFRSSLVRKSVGVISALAVSPVPSCCIDFNFGHHVLKEVEVNVDNHSIVLNGAAVSIDLNRDVNTPVLVLRFLGGDSGKLRGLFQTCSWAHVMRALLGVVQRIPLDLTKPDMQKKLQQVVINAVGAELDVSKAKTIGDILTDGMLARISPIVRLFFFDEPIFGDIMEVSNTYNRIQNGNDNFVVCTYDYDGDDRYRWGIFDGETHQEVTMTGHCSEICSATEIICNSLYAKEHCRDEGELDRWIDTYKGIYEGYVFGGDRRFRTWDEFKVFVKTLISHL